MVARAEWGGSNTALVAMRKKCCRHVADCRGGWIIEAIFVVKVSTLAGCVPWCAVLILG